MICENFAYPKLMGFFEEISAIPRGSYHEEKITEYLVSFANERGLECYSDSIGNVLINLPATEDKKHLPAILLQGHTDMVCEKNAGVEHDFLNDPLKLYVKDGWLRAEGTTLGADNGVAVAVMLALLDGAAESHRALQCLFTVSEEVGLDGAKAFDYSRIYARKMINMDSADEKMIIAGCAGGLRSSVIFPVEREVCEGKYIKVSIKGLFGGHSGEDIQKGRANANKLMGRALNRLFAADPTARLVSVNGGTKENAIPREAEAIIVSGNEGLIYSECEKISREIYAELVKDDSDFRLAAEECISDTLPMTDDCCRKTVFFMLSVANGVFEVNHGLSGVVEFSRNLGIVTTKEDSVEFVENSRSARESQIDLSAAELDMYAEILGGKSDHFNRYPGWVYSENSEIREEYARAYNELFGGEPEVEVIHAGLECGIIKQAVPDMDMLSCGPVVVNLHSPDEALDIASFERFFKVILNIVTK